MSGPLLLVGGAGSIGSAVLRSGALDVRHVLDVAAPAVDLRGATLHRCSLLEPEALAQAADALPPETVAVYAAGALDARPALDGVSRAIRVNVEGVSNLLLTLGARLRHLVYLSSVSVYGVPDENPIPESAPARPTHLYGVTKLAGESVAQQLAASLGIGCTVARVTQLYGLESAEGTLPHLLARRLAAGQPVECTGDPAAERDYLHVDDFVQALAGLVDLLPGGVVNVGAGRGITIRAVFEAAHQAFGAPQPDLPDAPDDASFSQVLDTTRLRELLAFAPRTTLAAWFEERAAAIT